MANDLARRALHLLEEALELNPSERPAFIDTRCDGNEALRSEVISLLAAHEDANDFLEPSSRGVSNTPTTGDEIPANPHHAIAPLAPGLKLGDFEILQLLGSGGMGQVFRARQHSLNRDVALKVLPPHHHFSRDARARFRKEIQATARLSHTNLIAVFASGEDQGYTYYAMELVRGPTLGQIIAQLRETPPPEFKSSRTATLEQRVSVPDTTDQIATLRRPNRASPVEDQDSQANAALADVIATISGNYFHWIAQNMSDVASALDHAHQHGVIHRDVKPGNMLFADDGTLRLGDFGLARILDEPSITRSSDQVGTPYYMAPEQLLSGRCGVGTHTDIYALGISLYELLTLTPAFPGNDREEVLAQIGRVTPATPRRINPRVPRDLQTICLKAIATNPEDRYVAACEMSEDLQRFVQGFAVRARPPGLFKQGTKFVRRHRILTTVTLIAIVAAASTGVLGYRSLIETRQRLAEQIDQYTETAFLAVVQGDTLAANAALDQAQAAGGNPLRLDLIRIQALMESAKFERSIDRLQHILASTPRSFEAHVLLAEAYARSGQWHLGQAHRSRGIAEDPGSVNGYILLGRMEAYYDSETAEGYLDQAVSRERQNIVARLVRGSIRAQRAYSGTDAAKAEQAIEDLRLAATLLPDTPAIRSQQLRAHLIAAIAFEAADNPDKLAQHRSQTQRFAEMLASFPGSYEAHRWRGYYFDHLGNLDRSIVEWQAISNRTIGYHALALLRAQRYQEALDRCATYGATSPTGTADFCAALVKSTIASDIQPFIDSIDLSKNRRWSPGTYYRNLYILNCLAGRPDDAAVEFQKSASEDLAERYRNTPQNQYISGRVSADEYLALSGGSRSRLTEAHALIGLRCLAVGDRNKALDHLHTAVDHRQDFDFLSVLCRALLEHMHRHPEWPAWIR